MQTTDKLRNIGKSPGNPWRRFRRKGRLRWEGFAEKEGFKPRMKEWKKAGPPTVDSFTNGTSRRLVRAERRERRPGRSATRTSWLRYDGAVPRVDLYVITAVLSVGITRHILMRWVPPAPEPKNLEARTCLENENPCLEKSGSVLQFLQAYLCSFT